MSTALVCVSERLGNSDSGLRTFSVPKEDDSDHLF